MLICLEFLKDGKIGQDLADEARENTNKEDDSEVSMFFARFGRCPGPHRS